jgi:tRNA 2-thiouridine synthesizing protein E
MTIVADDIMALDLGEEGYLNNPADWNEAVALKLASGENIELCSDHWDVIHFMREYYADHGIAADARFVIKYIAG